VQEETEKLNFLILKLRKKIQQVKK